MKVDTVTLTVFMTTGTLMIQGNHDLDWFLRHLQSIMDHYDSPVQEQHPKTEDENALRKGKDEMSSAERNPVFWFLTW